MVCIDVRLCRLYRVAVIIEAWLTGCSIYVLFFFQAEDGIRDLVRSRGLGDVYKRQQQDISKCIGRGRDLALPKFVNQVSLEC